MTWLWAWWKRFREDDDLGNAKAALESAKRVEPEVKWVGEELRKLQRTNHFSPMVQEAIRRYKEAS